jgi:hypothetical protein
LVDNVSLDKIINPKKRLLDVIRELLNSIKKVLRIPITGTFTLQFIICSRSFRHLFPVFNALSRIVELRKVNNGGLDLGMEYHDWV